MEPTIKDGDIVVYSQYVAPSEGDMVRLSSQVDSYPYPVIHRAIDVNSDTVQTKGDNNSYKDKPVPREDVDATVLFVLNVPEQYQFYRPLAPSDYNELEEAYQCRTWCQLKSLVFAT